MKKYFALLTPYLTRRRGIALGAVALVATMTFAFLAVRKPAAQEATLVVQDTAAADSAAVQTDSSALPLDAVGPKMAPAERALADSLAAAAAPAVKYRAGEDPAFAEKMGWPVKGPQPLAGAIIPAKRIVAYYGNPLSKRMGVLGEYAPDVMLKKLDAEVARWNKADPATPVQPALHLIVAVAQADAGPSGKYRIIMRDTLVEQVHRWAKSRNAILFIDIQTGHSNIRELLPKFDHFLVRPDVHLAIDPEFMMKGGHKPGAKIGSIDASDINYATAHLAELVRKHNLPPKVLVIHRFTRNMVTNSRSIQLRPEVQIVMDMDGWGAAWLKRDSYKDYIVREPVQFTGFKLFYHNDTKKGDPLMSPEEVLKLRPQPLYIQYQ